MPDQLHPDTTGDATARPFGSDAAAVKRTAATSRAELTRTVAQLQQVRAAADADLKRRRAALDAEHAARRAELEAQLGPLRQQLARLQEVMWTVDLYLGRDETLRLIRDGQPAPGDIPITIRQKVLVMAEESLVAMDRVATGMTADDLPEFVAWLLDNPAHVQRILPEQRGVVVLIPTRVESRSGNPYEDAARNAANQASFWLLRNGERLYLLTVDAELRVTDRVLPRRREFTEVFEPRLFGLGRFEGTPVAPGSDEWLDMEKRADARRRHYMRILLVLQGIIDRTPVWRPLPEWGVNLLSLADQDAGKIVLLQDDEESIQLGDGRESFRDWQVRLNNRLRPGLRLIGDWRSRDFADLRDRQYDHGHPRLSPPTVNTLPDPTVPHLIEDRRDGGLVIRYARTDQVWRRDVPVPDEPGYVYRGLSPTTPTRRASCLVHPGDTWVLPFDLVTVAELEYYLGSRENRSAHFLSMVPTVKAALAAKAAEAEAERPFRDLIGRVLVDDGAELDTVDAVTDDLVHWWKVANAWARPLHGAPEHEARAVRDIVAEHQARRRAAGDDTDAMIAAGRAVPGVIAVARTRRGQWHAYVPSTPAPPGERVYLDMVALRRDGTRGDTRTWCTLSQRSASALVVAWSGEEWTRWRFTASARHHLTGPERDAVISAVVDRTGGLPICVTELHDPRRPAARTLVSYAWTADHAPEDQPAILSASPLDWHHSDKVITTRAWRVEKGPRGVALGGDARGDLYSTAFAAFAPGGADRWGGSPWWPDDAPRYEARPRLVWSDPTVLDRLAGYVQRCAAAAGADRSRRAEHDRMIRRHVDVIMQRIRADVVAAARARFVADYGPDALDLWPAHLESLALTDPVSARVVTGVVAAALRDGRPVVGRTLDSLVGRHAQGGRVDLAGMGHIVVPDPAADAHTTTT